MQQKLTQSLDCSDATYWNTAAHFPAKSAERLRKAPNDELTFRGTAALWTDWESWSSSHHHHDPLLAAVTTEPTPFLSPASPGLGPPSQNINSGWFMNQRAKQTAVGSTSHPTVTPSGPFLTSQHPRLPSCPTGLRVSLSRGHCSGPIRSATPPHPGPAQNRCPARFGSVRFCNPS